MHHKKDHVVLIHGLGRSWKAMLGLHWYLRRAGYQVLNFDYPSRRITIKQAVDEWLSPALQNLKIEPGQKVHFVTHSLGGLVFRAWAKQRDTTFPLGRTVMLAPPNQGSEIMDHLQGRTWAYWLFGPVVNELGTGPESTAKQLGPVPPETHIIMGRRSLIPLFKHLLGPESDGVVTILGGHAAGEAGFSTVDSDHTLIMWRPSVLRKLLDILRSPESVSSKPQDASAKNDWTSASVVAQEQTKREPPPMKL
jgi:pimeloyl-ACP methyl ester carboxylesterase